MVCDTGKSGLNAGVTNQTICDLQALFEHDVMARNATFDIQFGHLERATNMNTSWDSARYEVCGHK